MIKCMSLFSQILSEMSLCPVNFEQLLIKHGNDRNAKGFTSKMKWSFSVMSAMLRLNLFTYRSLLDWLDKPYETPPAVPQFEQLGLFN